MFLDLIGYVLQLTSIVCFVLILVKMFQNGQTGLGIGCIVGLICCGIGGLIAFVFGWIKSSEWNAKGIMLIWTVAIIAGFVLGLVHTPAWVVSLQQQAQQMQPVPGN